VSKWTHNCHTSSPPVMCPRTDFYHISMLYPVSEFPCSSSVAPQPRRLHSRMCSLNLPFVLFFLSFLPSFLPLYFFVFACMFICLFISSFLLCPCLFVNLLVYFFLPFFHPLRDELFFVVCLIFCFLPVS